MYNCLVELLLKREFFIFAIFLFIFNGCVKGAVLKRGKHLDYSPKSLEDLWDWIESKMECVEEHEPCREIRVIFGLQRRSFFSYEMNMILIDAGMYFNEVIIHNIPEYYLGVWIKSKNCLQNNLPFIMMPSKKEKYFIITGIFVLRVAALTEIDKNMKETGKDRIHMSYELIYDDYLWYKEQALI